MSITKPALAAAALLLAPASSHASTFTTIYTFTGASGSGDGAAPMAGLTRKVGFLYGTTCSGGLNQGTIYKIKANAPHTYASIYNFGTVANDGDCPAGDLTLRAGSFYGTTSDGGVNGDGTLFRIAASSTLYSQLWSFGGPPDGSTPQSSNLLYRAGSFYGTTEGGGAGFGTVFRLTGSSEVPISSFTAPMTQTAGPQNGVIFYNGYYYGTATKGGAYLHGNIFKTLATAPYTTTDIYDFGAPGPNGAEPRSRLVLVGNMMYGTTATGNGAQNNGTVFSFDPNANTLITLYTFQGAPDGFRPWGDIVVNGNMLYGTTVIGGASGGSVGNGTVFAVDINAQTESTIWSFTGGVDGSEPYSGLMYDAPAGAYFGTTSAGAQGGGTVFRVTLP